MTTPSELSELSEHRADAGLIDEYMGLPSAENILAQLAPAQTMDEASVRHARARQTLTTRRAALARQLSGEGLFLLLDRLAEAHGIVNWFDGDPLSEFTDARPAQQEYELRKEQCFVAARLEEQASAEAKIRVAKKILGNQWIQGAVEARQWMATVIGKPEERLHADKILRAWDGHLRATQYLELTRNDHQSAPIAPTDPVIPSYSMELQTELDEVRKFLDDFNIDSPVPNPFAQKSEQFFLRYWPEEKKLETDIGKANAVIEWHSFWQKFGTGGVSRRKKDTVKQSAGKKRAHQRERNRWIRFTQGFVQWAKKRVITPSLIEEFPKMEGVELVKGRAFLKTLLNAKEEPSLQSELVDSLEEEGINLPEGEAGKQIADDCYSILVLKKLIQE